MQTRKIKVIKKNSDNLFQLVIGHQAQRHDGVIETSIFIAGGWLIGNVMIGDKIKTNGMVKHIGNEKYVIWPTSICEEEMFNRILHEDPDNGVVKAIVNRVEYSGAEILVDGDRVTVNDRCDIDAYADMPTYAESMQAKEKSAYQGHKDCRKTNRFFQSGPATLVNGVMITPETKSVDIDQGGDHLNYVEKNVGKTYEIHERSDETPDELVGRLMSAMKM